MANMTDLDKLRALLPHWIEHNAAHAAEFRRWAKPAGEAEADIEAAAAQMEAANAALAAALETLGGPVEHHPRGGE
ncbi:MAG: hypothetical protein PVH17_04860 [Anaerolineae bacterium]|jgi:hypothetical protein